MSNFQAYDENGRKFATKAALKKAVLDGKAVTFSDTSAINSRGTVSVDKLQRGDVIVGPDAYSRRDWYANVRNTKNGYRVV